MILLSLARAFGKGRPAGSVETRYQHEDRTEKSKDDVDKMQTNRKLLG